MSKKSFYERLLKIDRRLIFIPYIMILSIPFFIPMAIPITVSKYTKSYYDAINKIPEGSTVAIDMSIYGTYWPDIGSAAERTVAQLWKRDIKIVFFTLHADCLPLIVSDINAAKALMPNPNEIKYGVNYVELGFIPGMESGLAALSGNIRGISPKDEYGNNLDDLPIMQGINSGADFSMVIFMGGASGDEILGLRQWQVPFNTPLIALVIMGSFPPLTPYLETGQMLGVLAGMGSAAEYEYLTGIPGPALLNSNSMSIAIMTIIALLILGNILLLYGKYTGREET
jgi:hypothetical protein